MKYSSPYRLLIVSLLLLFIAAACSDEQIISPPENISEEEPKKPYWWREDPFFADKVVDEERSLALLEENIVVYEDSSSYLTSLAHTKIKEKYGDHLQHMLQHHADAIISEINGTPSETEPCPCQGLVYDGEIPPHCDEGNGGGGGSPPPPPPEQEFSAFTKLQAMPFFSNAPPEPRALELKYQLSSNITIFFSRQVSSLRKNAVEIWNSGFDDKFWIKIHTGRKEFFYSGPPVFWAAGTTHTPHNFLMVLQTILYSQAQLAEGS